ncbi:UNKNOWN [Stylonychia lemnae]|uniref:Uncharacterized protein n=1 Tax=Stylonychia lemnae TaxID=5949 RepID=A0A078A876_STYLE|nr:UNKNOWN [Stylonychia lemnae]|eukprot:CDW78424.1 UNKNOWN [Stylonychia lemnae]
MSPSVIEIRDSIYSKDPRLLQTIDDLCYITWLFSRQVLLLGTTRHWSCLFIIQSQLKQTFVMIGRTLRKPQDLLEGRHVFEWWQEQCKTTQLIQGEITNSPVSLLKPQDLRAGRYIFEWWQDLLTGTQYYSMVQPIHGQVCNLLPRFQQQIYSGLTIRKISMSSGNSDYYIIEEAQFPLLTINSPKEDLSPQEEDTTFPLHLGYGYEDDLSPLKSQMVYQILLTNLLFPQCLRKEDGNSPHGIIPYYGNNGYSTVFSIITQCRGKEIASLHRKMIKEEDRQLPISKDNIFASTRLSERISVEGQEEFIISNVSKLYQTITHLLLIVLILHNTCCWLINLHSQSSLCLSNSLCLFVSVLSAIFSSDLSIFPAVIIQYIKQEDTLGICISTEISTSPLIRVVPQLEGLEIRDWELNQNNCVESVYLTLIELWTIFLLQGNHSHSAYFLCELPCPSSKSFKDLFSLTAIINTLYYSSGFSQLEQALNRWLGLQKEICWPCALINAEINNAQLLTHKFNVFIAMKDQEIYRIEVTHQFYLNLDPSTYYINNQAQTSYELGTKDFPYKQLDDVFREVFNNANDQKYGVTIKIMSNNNLTLYSESMPLFLINHNFTIMSYTEQINQQSRQLDNNQINGELINIEFATIDIYYGRQYNRTQMIDSEIFNPTLFKNGTPIPYSIKYLQLLDQQVTSTFEKIFKYKFFLNNSQLIIFKIRFIEHSAYSVNKNALINSGQSLKWINISDCEFYIYQGIFRSEFGM